MTLGVRLVKKRLRDNSGCNRVGGDDQEEERSLSARAYGEE